jgi:hypothetical protein
MKTKPAADTFGIDAISGEIRLQRTLNDVGGIFELTIAASDLNEDITHIARTSVKIWICDEGDLGRFVFEKSPRSIQQGDVAKYLRLDFYT